MSPELQQEGAILQGKLGRIDRAELVEELQKQVNEKLSSCLESIPTFCKDMYNFSRRAGHVPIAWQEGSTCLYEYATSSISNTKTDSSVLIIPSLINRHYILDLAEGNSFVRYLAACGINTYLAAWNEPEENECNFSLDNYIARVAKMIAFVYEKTGRKPVLAGYCMGGLLAIAAAMAEAGKLKAVAFLATPWDFHVQSFPKIMPDTEALENITALLESYNIIPAAVVQAMFYYTYSHVIGKKFEIYAHIREKNYTRDTFMAVENWVNDGISMTTNVARECLIGWVHNNNVAGLRWKNGKEFVTPDHIKHLPGCFILPKKDSIVPTECSMPLTGYFRNCSIITPDAGHIGMITGRHAGTQTWEPFMDWIRSL